MAKHTGAVKHTHQYMKRMDGRWACSGIEGCSHFMPKNMDPLPAGMNSRCWGCMKEFQLAPYNMEDDKPMCDTCMEDRERNFEYLASKGLLDPPSGVAAFKGGNATERLMALAAARANQVEEPSKDEIEVIEADEVHAADCEIYMTNVCTCK